MALAIIKALYALTILPDLESSLKGLTFEGSPPTTTLVLNGKPDSISMCFTSEAERLGYNERIKAATPATLGAANDVPLTLS